MTMRCRFFNVSETGDESAYDLVQSFHWQDGCESGKGEQHLLEGHAAMRVEHQGQRLQTARHQLENLHHRRGRVFSEAFASQ